MSTSGPRGHVGSLFLMNSRKALARDIFDTFAPHAGLAYDVTDAVYWAQNGSTHGRVLVIFKRRLL